MAYIPVDDNPSLNLNMDSFETTTPVHCDQMNPRHKQHLNNEKALLTQVKLKADIASPTLTGIPKAPTATTTDDSTQIATTAFVKAQGYVAANSGDTAATVVSAMDTISTEFPVPAAGESTKTLWGKVKKFIQDINNLRASMLFIGSIVNNCVTSNSALPLSAAQGKVLMDLYTQLNSDLTNRFLDDGFRCEFGNKTLHIHLGANDTLCIDNIYNSNGVISRLQWDTTGVLQMTVFDGAQWKLVKDYNAG